MDLHHNFVNRAILVCLDTPNYPISQEDIDEFEELAKSAGAKILVIVNGKNRTPNAKYFASKGKIQEINSLVIAEQADLVIFNHTLTAAQERNLETCFQCRVLARTGLILDIFAMRARSFEGRLQVELAQLQHLSTRLVRGWGHLERQRGGIGLRSGPGEKQLEVDRRLLRERIKAIKKRLEKVRTGRQQSRRARQRAEIPTISLVGYTNAGKSTLFNKLTTASVHASDQLFATLDPTFRRIELPEIGHAILIDTVGFIRHLPHELIEAFHATLEESKEANLLLHVIDAHDTKRREKIKAVNHVLKQIDAQQTPQLLVYNKIDLTNNNQPRIDKNAKKIPKNIRISAISGKGINLLLEAIKNLLSVELREYKITLEPKQSKLRANLYKLGKVLAEKIDKTGKYELLVRISQRNYERLFPNLSKK